MGLQCTGKFNQQGLCLAKQVSDRKHLGFSASRLNRWPLQCFLDKVSAPNQGNLAKCVLQVCSTNSGCGPTGRGDDIYQMIHILNVCVLTYIMIAIARSQPSARRCTKTSHCDFLRLCSYDSSLKKSTGARGLLRSCLWAFGSGMAIEGFTKLSSGPCSSTRKMHAKLTIGLKPLLSG